MPDGLCQLRENPTASLGQALPRTLGNSGPQLLHPLGCQLGQMSVFPNSFLGSDGSRSLCSFLEHWLRTKGPGAAEARDEFLPIFFLCTRLGTQWLPLSLHLLSQATALVYDLYLLWGFGFSIDL